MDTPDTTPENETTEQETEGASESSFAGFNPFFAGPTPEQEKTRLREIALHAALSSYNDKNHPPVG